MFTLPAAAAEHVRFHVRRLTAVALSAVVLDARRLLQRVMRAAALNGRDVDQSALPPLYARPDALPAQLLVAVLGLYV